MDEIEKTNKKWLKIMNNTDISGILQCPTTKHKPHNLIKYKSISLNKIIITCPVEDCEFYDYNTFKVNLDSC